MSDIAVHATTLRDVLVERLMDAYDADRQLLLAWPRLGSAAEADSLRRLCDEGVDYTRERLRRLERAFAELGTPARAKPCVPMAALLEAATEVACHGPPGPVRDAALLAAIQTLSHYGHASYGSIRGFAEALAETGVVKLMAKSYKEKAEAIEEMAGMAESEIDPAAAQR
jgi:ferritin-like metal-binding protein YciE